LELDEEGTRISLTIVDTPGFGDQIDNEARYDGHWRECVASKITDEMKASVKLLAISSDNTTTFSQRSLASSVIPASATIVFTPYSTSSLPLAMGKQSPKADLASLTYS
jgi:hypothetical protein